MFGSPTEHTAAVELKWWSECAGRKTRVGGAGRLLAVLTASALLPMTVCAQLGSAVFNRYCLCVYSDGALPSADVYGIAASPVAVYNQWNKPALPTAVNE